MRPPGRHGARPAPSAKGAPRAGCPWSARTQPGSVRAAGRAALRSCVRLSWLGQTVPRDLLRVTNSASQVEVLSPAPHGLDALQQQLQFLVRQRQAREQGVLVEQEIRDDLAPEQVQLAELGDLGGPLQQEA